MVRAGCWILRSGPLIHEFHEFVNNAPLNITKTVLFIPNTSSSVNFQREIFYNTFHSLCCIVMR
jgi:hypothetical protein